MHERTHLGRLSCLLGGGDLCPSCACVLRRRPWRRKTGRSPPRVCTWSIIPFRLLHTEPTAAHFLSDGPARLLTARAPPGRFGVSGGIGSRRVRAAAGAPPAAAAFTARSCRAFCVVRGLQRRAAAFRRFAGAGSIAIHVHGQATVPPHDLVTAAERDERRYVMRQAHTGTCFANLAD